MSRSLLQSSTGVLLVGAPPPPSGGIASHLDDLARLLRGAGTRVHLARVPPRTSRSPVRVAQLLGALGGATLRGDVVHLHTNGHNAGSWRLAGAVAALTPSERALLTVHSGLAPEYIARHRATCRLLAARFHRVICVSEAIAGALREAGVDEEKLVVAPAFSAALLPLPRPPAGLNAIRRGCRGPLLAAVITPGPEYGAAVLIDAFAMLRRSLEEAQLVLFGPGAREAALDELVRARGLTSQVHRYGDLPRAEALAVMAAADVFVRPTLADGDAVSVREALALSVRTVASDAAVRPAGVVIFPAGDAPALCTAVDQALRRAPAPPAIADGIVPLVEAWRAAGVWPLPVAPVLTPWVEAPPTPPTPPETPPHTPTISPPATSSEAAAAGALAAGPREVG